MRGRDVLALPLRFFPHCSILFTSVVVAVWFLKGCPLALLESVYTEQN